MNDSVAILQIVPRAPGTQDGVGDYAATVARQLRDLYSRQTIFAAGTLATTLGEADSFPMVRLDRLPPAPEISHIILHYVN